MSAAVYHRKLARMLDAMGSFYNLNDILTLIAEGQMQSFVEGDSWIITRIAIYPRQKVLEVFAAIGDLDELRVLHDRILDYAGEVGAGVISAFGRKGWISDARRRGWRVKARYYVYQREM